MPASFATQRIQVVKETSYGVTPGTPVYKRFNALQILPKPMFTTNPFAASGLVVPSIVTTDDEWVEGDVAGRMAFNDIGFPLTSLFGAPTTTLATGGVATAKQHVWTWDGGAEPVPISYTAEYGDGALADRITGLFFKSMDFGGGRQDGLDFSSSILAKPLTEGITLTAGATDVVAKPISAPQMDVYLDTTWAGLGTSKLLQTYNANVSIADRYDRTRPINSTKSSDGLVQLPDEEHTLDLQMAVDATSKSYLPVIRAGGSRYAQVRYTSAEVIDGTAVYSFKMDAAVLFTGTGGYEEYNGLNAITWNTRIARDSGGNCLRFTLVNDTAAY